MTRVLRQFAGLRLSVMGFLLLAVGLVVHHQASWLAPWSVVLPIALLALNLVSALLVDPRFRGKPALFGFHVCLLLLAGIAAWGQLSSLHGRIIAIEGLGLDPTTFEVEADSPWAPSPQLLEGIAQGKVRIDYGADLDRRTTRSEMYSPEDGWSVVGDDVALQYRGFRVYTTSNKGFAAILSWVPSSGEAQLGSIVFPSFPARQIMQRVDWHTPVGQHLQFELGVPPVPFERDWTLDRTTAADAPLRVTIGGLHRELRAGDSMAVAGGSIRYERVSMWMGYRITYAPGLPLLFSTALLGILLMAVDLLSGRHSGKRTRSNAVAAAAGKRGDLCR